MGARTPTLIALLVPIAAAALARRPPPGKPYREIREIADTSGASLIVMGIHGHNPLERLFFGSTTLHVLRQAGCPVLTVRGPAPEQRR